MYDEYVTKDLGISAMLIASGHLMQRMFWKDRIAFFVFNDNDTCNRLSHLFLFGQVMVSAKAYYEAIKTLKIEIAKGINLNDNKERR